MPYFDDLMAEYDSLKGTDEYALHLEKIDNKIHKEYLIRACLFTIVCLQYGLKEDAASLIKDFNLKIKLDDKKLIDKEAIAKLEKKIKQLKTVLKVNEIQEAEESQSNKKTVWEDLIVYIDQVVGTKVDYNCPVALYLSYEKQAKAITKARKKK